MKPNKQKFQKKDRDPNHLYLDLQKIGRETADVGEFLEMRGKYLVFVADNGIKFLININLFASLTNVSKEVVDLLK